MKFQGKEEKGEAWGTEDEWSTKKFDRQKTSQKKILRTENFGEAKFLGDEGRLFYYTKSSIKKGLLLVSGPLTCGRECC